MALDQYKTQILLLHSQQSTLDSLSSGFSEKYSVHMATSGTEALNIFNDTPVHVIVSAQDLPGMSGLDALREAKKRSPETIGILLAGSDQSDGLEALVGDKEVFQIVRGEVTPESLVSLIDSATKRARLLALSESANDTTADVDQPEGEHIVMETSENGSAIISDGTGQMPALKPSKISIAPDAGGREVDVLVLTKDEEFLSTIRDSTRGLHNVHHAVTPTQADEFAKAHRIGVLVTDAAMVGSNIEILTQRLRQSVPRLVAVVAGRRDDGELLMDLINRGQVYRFLLKPVSPGRARLAIEASVKHHMDAPDTAFKSATTTGSAAAPAPKPEAKAAPAPQPKPQPKSQPKPQPKAEVKPPQPMKVSRDDSLLSEGLDEAFGDDSSFTETMTGIASSFGEKIAGVRQSLKKETKPEAAPIKQPPASGGGILQNPKVLVGVAAGVIAIAVVGWFMLGSDNAPPPAEVVDDTSSAPSFEEIDIPLPAAAPAASADNDVLEQARAALDAGRLIDPPGDNAIELFVAAQRQNPGDTVIAAELAATIDEVVSLAESAILEQRLDDAALALTMIEMANPENPRLTFLSAQLNQLQLRKSLDDARVAIREGRFEDAGALISSAATISGNDAPEIQLVSQELANARSEQRVDEVLALANSRLEQNRLIEPSNNNARYYFELALSNDPDNTVARQGLTIIASKLALQSRAAIDAGQLTNAEDLIRTARSLDPESAEVAAATVALQSARDAEAAAEQEREAEAARLQAQREAEAERERLAAEAAAAAAAAAVAAQSNVADSAPSATGSSAENDTSTAQPDGDNPTGSGIPGETAVASDPGSQQAVPGNTEAGAAAVMAASNNDASESAAPANNAQAEESTPGVPGEIKTVPVSSLTRVNYVAPKYPRSAQRRNVTGSVDLAFTVLRNGSVADIEVLDSKPGQTFDQAAMDAVAQWRFEPAVEQGQTVERRTAVRLAFNLQ